MSSRLQRLRLRVAQRQRSAGGLGRLPRIPWAASAAVVLLCCWSVKNDCYIMLHYYNITINSLIINILHRTPYHHPGTARSPHQRSSRRAREGT